ncbi:MAG: hypothetical protein PGN25_10995 [Methylorubrum populi]
MARLQAVGLGSRDWTWGGGTVLMLRHRHRRSRDVDIFINDVQYLSYLSPRLDDRETSDLMDYHEQANHLRLEYPEGEVDFLTVAPVFPGLKPHTMSLEGISGDIQLMQDKEICCGTSPSGAGMRWTSPWARRTAREAMRASSSRRRTFPSPRPAPPCSTGSGIVEPIDRCDR